MAEEILINATSREVRIALLDNKIVQEVYIERRFDQSLIGKIYKGKVRRLLGGLQAAFIDIGLERSAFLHVKDIQGCASVDADIRDYLHVGQELLVQVYKNPLGSKGHRLTTRFTIPSRYLVLTPLLFQVSVSQRITDTHERERLLQMITPSQYGGYIFRTAANGALPADIETDKAWLNHCWMKLEARTQQLKSGDVVYEDIPILSRVIRDLAGQSIERILIDDPYCASQMRDFAQQSVPALVHCIEDYSGDKPIFDTYSVEEELQKALESKVPLKSGGYLIFDQTEAMTTIDVNTGSYLGKGKIDETIFQTNKDAVDVIARQIRLRNLGGIIIIDFIDMVDPKQKEELLQLLAKALEKDTAKTEISELSSLGLVQMTRKRTRESLEHVLCVTCPTCNRRGLIKSLKTMSYEIFRALKRVDKTYPFKALLIIASKELIHYLMEEESLLLSEWEAQLATAIKLQVDSTYMQEQYDILPMSQKE